MPFVTFVHYVQPPPPATTTPPPPPPTKRKKKIFLDLDSCQFVKKIRKITNTESSWQIVQIRKKIGRVGVGGGEVCVVLAGGGRGVSEFF